MPRLYYGNFDCEHTWADPTYRTSGSMRRLAAELTSTWCAIAKDGDRIWLSERVEEGFQTALVAAGLAAVEFVWEEAGIREDDRCVPWGWTAAARGLAERTGAVVDGPAVDLVRAVNARSFRFGLEAEFGVALPGSGIIAAPAELAAAIAGLPGEDPRGVLTAECGLSGRERFLGTGRTVPEGVAGWMRKRTGLGRFVLEPWVDRIDEAGLHFTIPDGGGEHVRFEGSTPLLVGQAGRYRGSRFERDAAAEERWGQAIEVGRRVAVRLGKLRYRGPLGIDACRYRDDEGHVRLRALQDLNARHTMGRLALGLRRLLGPGDVGTWCHVRWPAKGRTWWDELVARLDPHVRVVRTSPFELDGSPVAHGTLALVGPREAVRSAERVVLAAG